MIFKIRRAEKVAERILEASFFGASMITWSLVVALSVADGLRSVDHMHYTSVLYGHTTWGFVVFTLGCICLVLVFTDVATYRPTLFALCAESATALFSKLGIFSMSLRKQLNLVTEARATYWSDVKEYEEDLLDAANQFVVLDRLRARIARRTVVRLAAMVAALALIGYGLATVTEGTLLASSHANAKLIGAGLPEYIYFTMTTFFTIGFGDIYPAHTVAGYSFLVITVATFAVIAYFVFTELAASQSDFRNNLKCAVAAYVLQKSAL